MKLGLVAWFPDPASDLATGIGATARLAEDAGFESIWMGEHLALPVSPPAHMPATSPLLDPFVALAFAAAATTRLRIGTGVVLLPLRNPFVLAKTAASLDVLSRGRLVLGVGVGSVEAEIRAAGGDFEGRGAVADEDLEVLYHLWYDDAPEHHGARFDFANVDAHPRPVQRPLPVVVGGRSRPALRRAARFGTGWYGVGASPADSAAVRREVDELAGELDRPATLGAVEISTQVYGRLTPQLVAEHAAAGVERLVVTPAPTSDGVRRAIDAALAAVADAGLG